MAVTAINEPTPTASATDGADLGGLAPQPTGDTASSSVQENSEGPPGESPPQLAAPGPSENSTGPTGDDAEGPAATSPTSIVAAANTADDPANKAAADAGENGNGNGGEDENKSAAVGVEGVDQPNLDEDRRDGGGTIVAAAGPASTSPEDGLSKEAPVRIEARVLNLYDSCRA